MKIPNSVRYLGECMQKEELINNILQGAIKNSGHDLSTKLNGLNKGEIGLLGYLAFIENKVSAKILSDTLNISSARVAKLLNTLEKKAYIVRIKDDTDKRKIVVSISEEGLSLISNIRNEVYEFISYIIDEIGMEDILTYLTITKKISHAMQKKEGGNVCFR